MSIVLEGVRKALGGREILRGLDLEVRTGETLGVIGGSGSGKSMTLKHIIGLMTPDSGSIRVDGQEVVGLEGDGLYALRRKVGFVFQFGALFDSMTIGENVAMGLKRMGEMSPSEMEDRVAVCLDLVGLAGFEDRDPSSLSGGQKKRASLARAIATQPTHLLYDEPTTGLDPVTVTVIDRLVQRLAAELSVTSLLVTHDIPSAFQVCDRIAMLYEGRIRFVGRPEEFRRSDDPVLMGFIQGKPELLEGAS